MPYYIIDWNYLTIFYSWNIFLCYNNVMNIFKRAFSLFTIFKFLLNSPKKKQISKLINPDPVELDVSQQLLWYNKKYTWSLYPISNSAPKTLGIPEYLLLFIKWVPLNHTSVYVNNSWQALDSFMIGAGHQKNQPGDDRGVRMFSSIPQTPGSVG